MDAKHRDDFIKSLYVKTQTTLYPNFSVSDMRRLLDMDYTTCQRVAEYFDGKRFLKSLGGIGCGFSLSNIGVEYVEALLEDKEYRVVKLKNSVQLQPRLSIDGFGFEYEVLDENGAQENKRIDVYISDELSLNWGIPFPHKIKNAEKILLQYAKNTIIEKLKEGTLNDREELLLLTTSAADNCPYDSRELPDTKSLVFLVELGQKTLAQEVSENKLAASIIETRDTINALFKAKHNQKLLLLNQERNLLDLFKSAFSLEEFSHRVSSLGQMSRYFNEEILRKITGENSTDVRSVGLLEKLLTSIDNNNSAITETLKQIGRMRNGYPAHTDEIPAVIKAYSHFAINYPVDDFEKAWIKLLNHYLSALKELSKVLQSY